MPVRPERPPEPAPQGSARSVTVATSHRPTEAFAALKRLGVRVAVCVRH